MPQCYCININDFDWDNKEFVWQNKYFYVLPVSLMFHTPLSLELKIEQAMREIKKKGYKVDYPIEMFLQDGSFKGSLLVEIKNPREEDPKIRMIEKAQGKTFISRLSLNKVKKDVAKIVKQ